MRIRQQQISVPETSGWISASSAQFNLLLKSREIQKSKRFNNWLLIWSSKIHSYFSRGVSPHLIARLFQAGRPYSWVRNPKWEFIWTSSHQSTATLVVISSTKVYCKHHHVPFSVCCSPLWDAPWGINKLSKAQPWIQICVWNESPWGGKPTWGWKLLWQGHPAPLLHRSQLHQKVSALCCQELCCRWEIW